MKNSVTNQHQTANLQALFRGQEANNTPKVEPGRIQRSDGSTSSVVQQQAPKKSFGQLLAAPFIRIGQAIKNLFTRNIRTEANPAAMPAGQLSANEIKEGASISKQNPIDRPAKLTRPETLQDWVMRGIAESSHRDSFSMKANISGVNRDGYSNWQQSVIESNPIMKNVLSEFTKLQMNSTQKEWNATILNYDTICSKAIEFAENHAQLSEIANPVAREFANPNASAISLFMTLSDAHLQHNFSDRTTSKLGGNPTADHHTVAQTRILMRDSLASLGTENLLAINEQFNKNDAIFESLNQIHWGLEVENAINKENGGNSYSDASSNPGVSVAWGKVRDIGFMGVEIKTMTRDLLTERGVEYKKDKWGEAEARIMEISTELEGKTDAQVRSSPELIKLDDEKNALGRELNALVDKALEGGLGKFIIQTVASGGDTQGALTDLLNNNKVSLTQLSMSTVNVNEALLGKSVSVEGGS